MPAYKASTEIDDSVASPPKPLTTTQPYMSYYWLQLWSLLVVSCAIFACVLWTACRYPEDFALCSDSGSIYTVDADNPKVDCLVIRGSLIHDVGDYTSIQKRWQDSTCHHFIQVPFLSCPSLKKMLIGPKSAVVPGLADAHAHILAYGFKMNLSLDGCSSVREVLSRLKNFVLTHPDVLTNSSRWIEGMGWDQTNWPGGHYPTSNDFDAEPLLRGRPISLSRVDGHALWVSKTIIGLVGDIPQEVEGGIIVRHDDGTPTGIFVDNAMSLIPTPPWSEAQMMEYLNRTAKDALQYGLTSIHDAQASPDIISFFQRHAADHYLPFRVYLMASLPWDEYWGAKIPRLKNFGKGGRLTLRSIKLFTDGALGSWGAALLKPYTDDPSTSGIMRIPPSNLSLLVEHFWRDEWQVNIHCIGDRANKAVLDIYEKMVNNVTNPSDISRWRPRIEHAQVMTQEDVKRIGHLGVIASVQPTHATSDMWYAESRLGPDRIKSAYAYRSLLQSSNRYILPLGSDFPVEGINPLLGFYAAVTRLSSDRKSPHGEGGWYPEQRLTRDQTLKGMTLDAAYASFAEDSLGSLTPGKKADFVVFDRDIMTIPESEILLANVQATFIDGEIVYGSLI